MPQHVRLVVLVGEWGLKARAAGMSATFISAFNISHSDFHSDHASTSPNESAIPSSANEV
jgi:hypothetical protein